MNTLPNGPETRHGRLTLTGTLRLPKAPVTLWDRGVGLIPGWRTASIVESRRGTLPAEVAAMRSVLAANPRVLAAFNLECDGKTQTGDVSARIRRASIESAEQSLALAEFHADETPITTKALLRETLEEIGALTLLAQELRARIADEEMQS